MTVTAPPRTERLSRPFVPSTLEEWLAIPAEKRAEFIGGQIVYQAMPGLVHGAVQKRVGTALDPYDRRRRDPDRPGGWWISQEVDMFLGGIGCRPDLVGWERERHPRPPQPDARGLVTDVPSWICEVLSPNTATVDMGSKREAYHRAGVTWYWLADPHNRTLTVLRRAEPDYLIALVAGVGQKVAAAPFAHVEIDLDRVFDFDADEPASDG